jgi:hypothetical protein
MQEPTVHLEAARGSATASAQSSDRALERPTKTEGMVSEAGPSSPVPDPGLYRSPLPRWVRYFWIGGAFVVVMIVGIVGINLAPPRSTVSYLMGGVIGLGVAGALVMFVLALWLARSTRR